MDNYTQITYSNEVKDSISTVVLWGCDRCGATVWDKAVHNKWHTEWIHD